MCVSEYCNNLFLIHKISESLIFTYFIKDYEKVDLNPKNPKFQIRSSCNSCANELHLTRLYMETTNTHL